MDFDIAAKRLARDQTKHRQTRRPLEMSAESRREAELRKKQQAALAAERDRSRRQTEFIEQYFRQREQSLGVRHLCTLNATSIHGEGDKIALPPSILEQLTQGLDGMDKFPSSSSTPWTFRIGLRNPDYVFPASPMLQTLRSFEKEEANAESSSDDEEISSDNIAYLDELQRKYLSYTHATVVEFTQDEGHIGLPEPIASALLATARSEGDLAISVFRTKDQASLAAASAEVQGSIDVDEEKTPGHLAWGAFDLPDMPVEVSIVKLPKGKGATLAPTRAAVTNGFYELEDIKLVLEQSLVRSRATLTVGDTVYVWHRGKKYDLKVTALRPAAFNAVLCLNTDLEIDFDSHEHVNSAASSPCPAAINVQNDRKLSELTTAQLLPPVVSGELLPEEPPADAEGACLIQIRTAATHGRRRFLINSATIKDLLNFASSITTETRFQLVTRYPRRVFTIADGAKTLKEAGLTSKQELLMLELLN